MAGDRAQPRSLSAIARLANARDNVAVALSTLPPGTEVEYQGTWRLPHPVLEGHRFAVTPIRRGDKLLSWGYPFGRALCDIDPGEWIRNDSIVTALAGRDRSILILDAELPVDPNFSDQSLSQSARVDQAIQAAALPKPSERH